jgi:beta-glucanase (GH16 family)
MALSLGVVWAADAVKTEEVKPAVSAPEAAKTPPPASAVTPAPDTATKAAEKAAEAVKKAAEEATKPEADAKKPDGEAKKVEDKKTYGGGKFADEPAFQDDFLPDWEKNQKAWRVATWKQNGTQMSPQRCATDGQGFMVQTVLAGEPFQGGSMQTKGEWGYGRWVGRLKPSSVPGLLNSFFTDDWDDMTTADKDNDGTKFEVDIEFLTYTFSTGKGQVHLALHGWGKKNVFVKEAELDFNPSDDYHVYGFDILPDGIVWYADGKEIGAYKCPAGETVPDIKHEFFMNSWTSAKWIKGPPTAEGKYSIDWVKYYPLVKK